MSTTPDVAPPNAEIDHPTWCDPRFCEPDGAAVAHISAPVTWRMQGEDVEVVMRRRQTGLEGEVLIELHLTNEAYPQESTVLRMTPADRDRLVTGFFELTLQD